MIVFVVRKINMILWVHVVPQFDSTTLFNHLVDFIFFLGIITLWIGNAVHMLYVQSFNQLTNDWDVLECQNFVCGSSHYEPFIPFSTSFWWQNANHLINVVTWNTMLVTLQKWPVQKWMIKIDKKCIKVHYRLTQRNDLTERHIKEC